MNESKRPHNNLHFDGFIRIRIFRRTKPGTELETILQWNAQNNELNGRVFTELRTIDNFDRAVARFREIEQKIKLFWLIL